MDVDQASGARHARVDQAHVAGATTRSGAGVDRSNRAWSKAARGSARRHACAGTRGCARSSACAGAVENTPATAARRPWRCVEDRLRVAAAAGHQHGQAQAPPPPSADADARPSPAATTRRCASAPGGRASSPPSAATRRGRPTAQPMPQLKVRHISCGPRCPRCSQSNTGGSGQAKASTSGQPVRHHAHDVLGQPAAGDVGHAVDGRPRLPRSSSGSA